jgi:uncharacterized protein
MKNIIIGSVSQDAGKTSFVVGLGKALGKKFFYLKPFGDRLIYRKKRLWDYDSALITNIFGLEQSSDEMTIGFEHSKLRYMYDEAGTKAKLAEMVRNLQDSDKPLFIEGGKDLTYGTSVRLDTLSLVKYLGGKLILVISGDEGTILDDAAFVKKYVAMAGIDYSIVINKVNNLEDYKNNYLRDVKEMGLNVVGVVPFEQTLTQVSMSFIAEKVQARIVAGDGGLNKRMKQIFVGAVSGDMAAHTPLFKKSDKLLIISGDRADIFAAALDTNTAGIILTNNMVPSQNLLAKATDLNIPVLAVPFDTFQTAKQVDDMVPLLTKDDSERIDTLKKLIEQNVDIASVLA